MPTKFPRINLLVPSAIAQRLRQEAEFLHVKSRVQAEDGTELKSTADLVRWVVNLYIEACEVGEGPTYDWEETDPVPLTMDSTTKGRWEYAVKFRFATSYHQLAGNALCWYFDRLDDQAAKDAALLRNMQSMGALRVIGYLRARDYAALQTAHPTA
jgi:hypothetical protein